MDRTDDKPHDRLEGMLIAHRKVLAEILAAVERLEPGVTERMEDSRVLRDGQEDPGAVPTDGVALELAIAEETNRILDLSRILGRSDE